MLFTDFIWQETSCTSFLPVNQFGGWHIKARPDGTRGVNRHSCPWKCLTSGTWLTYIHLGLPSCRKSEGPALGSHPAGVTISLYMVDLKHGWNCFCFLNNVLCPAEEIPFLLLYKSFKLMLFIKSILFALQNQLDPVQGTHITPITKNGFSQNKRKILFSQEKHQVSLQGHVEWAASLLQSHVKWFSVKSLNLLQFLKSEFNYFWQALVIRVSDTEKSVSRITRFLKSSSRCHFSCFRHKGDSELARLYESM